MTRKKKVSKVIQSATLRADGLKTIGPTLNLGNSDLTLAKLQAEIADAETKLEIYNSALTTADTTHNDFVAAEKTLRAMNKRILKAVASQYGEDSNEYEAAGGTRESERKKPAHKPKAT